MLQQFHVKCTSQIFLGFLPYSVEIREFYYLPLRIFRANNLVNSRSSNLAILTLLGDSDNLANNFQPIKLELLELTRILIC